MSGVSAEFLLSHCHSDVKRRPKRKPTVDRCRHVQRVTTQLAVRDQPVYTANDLKALYELRYLTRVKSLVVQKVGVTQSGSLVDTWVCMCVGHVQSGLFYEVIVLSSVKPLIGQHWRVPAVRWRAHNVTRNSS